MGRSIQVAVRSCDRLLRETIAASLSTQQDIDVVGLTSQLDDLVALCRLRSADVVLIDVGATLPDADLERIRALRGMEGDIHIVLTYARLDAARINGLVYAGAASLVPHSRGIDALINAVRDPRQWTGRVRRPLALTHRDMEVLSLMSSGYSVNEMARLIGIGASTVENHKRRIFAKLSVHTQTDVVAHAARMGLLWSALHDWSIASPAERLKVVVVLGAHGAVRDNVVRALLRNAISVLVMRQPGPTEDDEVTRLQSHIVIVVVDGEAATWRAARLIGARTVFVTTREPKEPAIAEELIRGADAVLSAEDISDQLVHSVALVAKGYATADAARAMLRSLAARSPATRSGLTPRELDILRSISVGHSVRQTASALGITSKTVENTQARLFRKLSVHNRAQALAVAYNLGLIMED